jgi:sugar lactone lactonase YvrE
MMAATPRTLLDGLAFPECPRWHDGALYFSDMHAGVVWKMTPDGGATKVLELGSQPGGLGWSPDGTLHVVSMHERKLYRFTGDKLIQYADMSSFTPSQTNDMVMDREGRAYIGNFGFDLHNGATACSTMLLCVEPDGRVHSAAQEMWFPNGMVITQDEKTLIVAETFAGKLTAFDLETSGALTNRRVFAKLGSEDAKIYPDGICLDAEGGVWVTCPTSHKILRVDATGAVTDDIPLPDRDSFACMLGGTDRRDLYICTSAHGPPTETVTARSGRIEVLRVEIPGAGLP